MRLYRCACKSIPLFVNSNRQCVPLPHQPSSATPNIAQRRQLLPLLHCLAPVHSIIPHSAAHIHPLFPYLFSKDSSSLAKYTLAIIFHCKDTFWGRPTHYAQRDRSKQTSRPLQKVTIIALGTLSYQLC